MLVKFRNCPQCQRSFKPSSRHKLCPSCRHFACRKRCKHCGKEITCKSDYTLCIGCYNKAHAFKQDPKITAAKYTLKKCRNKGRKEHEITVTVEDLINLLNTQKGKCAYTNLPMALPTHRGCGDNRLCASLDRIDSSKGYTQDNIQWVISPINLMKNKLSDLEMKELLD